MLDIAVQRVLKVVHAVGVPPTHIAFIMRGIAQNGFAELTPHLEILPLVTC